MKYVIGMLTILLLILSTQAISAAEYTTIYLNVFGDTYVSSDNPDVNYGTEPYVTTGKNAYGYFQYAVIDLRRLGVDANDVIAADLEIYMDQTDGIQSVSIYEPENDWKEKVLTWENQPNTSSITTSLILGEYRKWVYIDLTDTVKYHLENPGTNKGLIMKQTNPSDRTHSFWSRDCRVSDPTLKCTADKIPYMKVKYWINSPPSPAETTEPRYGSVQKTKDLLFKWAPGHDPEGENLYHKIQIATDPSFENIFYESEWGNQTEASYTFYTDGEYFWRVISQDEHFNPEAIVYSDISQFEIDTKEIIEIEEAVEMSKEESVIETVVEKIIEREVEKEIPEIDLEGDVLGASIKKVNIRSNSKNDYCKFEYNRGSGEVKKVRCDIKQGEITIKAYEKRSNLYNLNISGTVPREMGLEILSYECKEKTFWDPRTWYGCFRINEKISEYRVDSRTGLDMPKGFGVENFTLNSSNLEARYSSKTNHSGKSIAIKRIAYLYTKIGDGKWLDILEYSKPITLNIPKSKNETTDGFRFPFNKDVGVTQWHGYTAYQSPHTGIDFGATRQNIYAIGDGYIRFMDWDSYYGKCLSGGYVMRVEHADGKQSVYMHLSKFANGIYKGKRIRRGEYLGVTGNSGAYNCQSLSYHLHFELRKDRQQSTHLDPAPYINTDWSKILTINSKQYPQRLLGDNPHPGK